MKVQLTAPQVEIYNSKEDMNLFLSGQGGGKSHLAGYISMKYIGSYPEVRGFIGANTYGQLSGATLTRIQKVWENFGMLEGVHYVIDKQPLPNFKVYQQKLKSYNNTVSFINGGFIYLGSMDNYKSLDGYEWGWSLMDEVKDTKEQAIKEVIIGRTRQTGLPDNRNPMYFLTSPAKVDWLNEWFDLDKSQQEIEQKVFSIGDFYNKKEGLKRVVISSIHHNQANLPEGRIEKLKEMYSGNQDLINALIYGSPFSKSGGEWLHSFNKLEHIENVEYKKELPLHISLDFNVNPYMTLLIHQVEHKEGLTYVNVIDEICLPNPKNTTPDVCHELIYRYEALGMYMIYYYGDPTGNNRRTNSKEARTDFKALEQVLYRFLVNGESERVGKRSEPVSNSKYFLNRIYSNGTTIRVRINPKCKNFIGDCLYLKEDANGSFIKKKVRDSTTGSSYEERGHCMDAHKDMMRELFKEDYEITKKYL